MSSRFSYTASITRSALKPALRNRATALTQAPTLQAGLLFTDTPLTHAMRPGVGNQLQRLFEHLRVVVQPQNLNAGIRQAHDNPAPHGTGADYGGLLDRLKTALLMPEILVCVY